VPFSVHTNDSSRNIVGVASVDADDCFRGDVEFDLQSNMKK
jgi:hypothetical protein